ncbi:hypothetical protein [Aphanothece hegewaldii]|uniref:hypothetical protein n=1 Tax=Aphanothece hegewaldii TaxID=1521625 RepID=UPI0015E6D54C|nr:hypothetical protein [Aphanothece hegewaldii]
MITTTQEDLSLAKVVQVYQADQQVKYLHLQAEIEVLLQQLKTVEQQKHQEKALAKV